MHRGWGVVIGLAAVTQLARIGHTQTQVCPPSEQPAQAPPPEKPPEQPVAGPRVVLRSNLENARLQQQTNLKQQTDLQWKDICIAPCNVQVDPAAVYRMGGRGVVVSSPFKLPRSSGDVHVDARVGSKGRRWVGLGLMLGGLGAGAGSLFFLNLANGLDKNDPFQDVRDLRSEYMTAATVGAIVALALEAVGLSLFAVSETSVEVR